MGPGRNGGDGGSGPGRAQYSRPGAAEPPRRRWRRAWVVLVGVPLLILALDFARPPSEQLSARLLLAAIGTYQETLARVLPRLGVRCRFEPSCSQYAVGAIRADGALIGSLRAGWRIVRCGPWTPAGTLDPP